MRAHASGPRSHSTVNRPGKPTESKKPKIEVENIEGVNLMNTNGAAAMSTIDQAVNFAVSKVGVTNPPSQSRKLSIDELIKERVKM